MWRPAAGAFLLLVAAGSSALTLGRPQGGALVGRPLDMAVPVSLDAGADPAALCVEADVFYAETRVDPARVNARSEPAGSGSVTVRVRASVPVDEPVVTVELRVGCREKLSRRYVLLAEQPADAFAPGNAPLPATSLPTVPATPPRTASPPAAGAMPAARGAEGAGAAATRRSGPPGQAARPAGLAGAPRQAAVSGPGRMAPTREQARLRLSDPLDLGTDRTTSLRLSTTLGDTPEASAQRRAEAAALWQALLTPPEDAQRNALRAGALESDVKGLRDEMQKSSSALTELRGQLEQAQRERYANALVYALLLALLVVGAAAGFVWRRRRGGAAVVGQDWWRGRAVADSDFGAESVLPARAPLRAAAPAPAARTQAAVDMDLSFTESVLDDLQARATSANPRNVPQGTGLRRADSDFGSSQRASMRSVMAEELHDIQQQADFFVSLGENDQAIDVLRTHIQANPETSALAWLDLLEILHRVERPEEYGWVSSEFNRVFNAEVPSFEDYREERLGLEAYQKALSRIVALWPSARVLEVIEESIFRKPGGKGAETFGIEAYRELLLLHNIGKEVIEGEEEPSDFQSSSFSQASGFSHTSIQPLSASRSDAAASDFGEPAGSGLGAIGLDINLDDELPPGVVAGEVGAGAEHSDGVGFDLPVVAATGALKPRS